MKTDGTLRRQILFVIAITVMIAGITCPASAEKLAVSIVTDGSLGPAASHGLEKLQTALQATSIAYEKSDSLENARGKCIIAAGLAGGGGPASNLLKEGKHLRPQGHEALIIRHVQ